LKNLINKLEFMLIRMKKKNKNHNKKKEKKRFIS
jgi:ribosome-associated translation inhibitor RaiA